MKNMKPITILALTSLITASCLASAASASTYSATASVTNLNVGYSSLSTSDIYFFPDRENSYSRARTGNAPDTYLVTEEQFLVNGWGDTEAINPAPNNFGVESNGQGKTTANSIYAHSDATTYLGGGTFSSDGFGTHFIDFYTYNPVTVTVDFDYLLSAMMVTGGLTESEGFVTGNASAQLEVRFYEGNGGAWGPANDIFFPYVLLGSPDDTGHETLSYTFSDMANPYARLEILAYTKTSASPVPLPGAVWLLGSGLLGIIAIRKKASH